VATIEELRRLNLLAPEVASGIGLAGDPTAGLSSELPPQRPAPPAEPQQASEPPPIINPPPPDREHPVPFTVNEEVGFVEQLGDLHSLLRGGGRPSSRRIRAERDQLMKFEAARRDERRLEIAEQGLKFEGARLLIAADQLGLTERRVAIAERGEGRAERGLELDERRVGIAERGEGRDVRRLELDERRDVRDETRLGLEGARNDRDAQRLVIEQRKADLEETAAGYSETLAKMQITEEESQRADVLDELASDEGTKYNESPTLEGQETAIDNLWSRGLARKFTNEQIAAAERLIRANERNTEVDLLGKFSAQANRAIAYHAAHFPDDHQRLLKDGLTVPEMGEINDKLPPFILNRGEKLPVQFNPREWGYLVRALEKGVPFAGIDNSAFAKERALANLPKRGGADVPDAGNMLVQSGPFAGKLVRSTDGGETVALPDGTIVSSRSVNAVDAGKVSISGTPEEIREGFAPGTDEQTEAGEAARAAGPRVADASFLLGQVNEAGRRAFGVPGWLADKAGGILGNLHPELGEDATAAIAGVSDEELAQLRLAGDAFVSSMIPEVTGEGRRAGEPSRVTEIELKLTRIATKIKDPFASYGQIKGAIGAAMMFALADQDQKRIVSGLPAKFDLSKTGALPSEANPDGSGRIGQALALRKLHMSKTQAADTMQLMQEYRNQLLGSGTPITFLNAAEAP
jgi:hypothetical protein